MVAHVETETERETFWQDKRVVVTGGAGFLGSHVFDLLQEKRPREVIVPRSRDYDLREAEVAHSLIKGTDVVIHLAALVGGIGYNQQNPLALFSENVTLGINVLEAARQAEVKKVVVVGTVCSYPKLTPVPFREEDLWKGYPEETNAPYGLAKRLLFVLAQTYRQQYGLQVANLLLVNLYGPRDNFKPESSHVIPALIKKFVEACRRGDKEVVVWGTGNATREFLYVKDAARGVLLAAQKYEGKEPVNIGSGKEISIRDLAYLIKQIVGFEGDTVWDTTKPDGQPRRMLDTSRAEKEFGFRATTDFREGLTKTISWYLQTRNEPSKFQEVALQTR